MTSLNPAGPVLPSGKPGHEPRHRTHASADCQCCRADDPLCGMPALEHLSLTYSLVADSCEAGTVELTACIARIRTCELPGALKAGLCEGLVVSLQRPTAHAVPRSLSVTIREAFD